MLAPSAATRPTLGRSGRSDQASQATVSTKAVPTAHCSSCAARVQPGCSCAVGSASTTQSRSPKANSPNSSSPIVRLAPFMAGRIVSEPGEPGKPEKRGKPPKYDGGLGTENGGPCRLCFSITIGDIRPRTAKSKTVMLKHNLQGCDSGRSRRASGPSGDGPPVSGGRQGRRGETGRLPAPTKPRPVTLPAPSPGSRRDLAACCPCPPQEPFLWWGGRYAEIPRSQGHPTHCKKDEGVIVLLPEANRPGPIFLRQRRI
jgi:hypothetical protein